MNRVTNQVLGNFWQYLLAGFPKHAFITANYYRVCQSKQFFAYSDRLCSWHVLVSQELWTMFLTTFVRSTISQKQSITTISIIMN